MNVLLMTNHLNAGGITSYLLTLSRELIQRGHCVWIASGGGDLESRFREMGVMVRTVPIRVKSEIHPGVFMSLRPLSTLIREENVDVIHSQTRVTQVAGQGLKRLTGRPHVVTCHGFFKRRLGRRLFPCWGDAVIAISPQVKAHLLNDFRVDPARVHLVVNGLDIREFPLISPEQRRALRQDAGLPEDQWIIGIIARLSDVKGHDVLIRAMPPILRSSPRPVHLAIVGDGKQGPYLKGLVRDLRLEKDVSFYPEVDQTHRFLSMLDVFVMPSLQEGLGLSVMEAQAAGVPVVASRVGGLPRLVEDGRTGLLVEPGQSEALADAVLRIAGSEQEAGDLARRARDMIEKEFSAAQMTEHTLRVYREAGHD